LLHFSAQHDDDDGNGGNKIHECELRGTWLQAGRRLGSVFFTLIINDTIALARFSRVIHTCETC